MEQKTQLQHVMKILREELADHMQKDNGPITQRIKAEVQNCSASLITRARKTAGIKSIEVGKRWQWVLPASEPVDEDISFTPAPELPKPCIPCTS